MVRVLQNQQCAACSGLPVMINHLPDHTVNSIIFSTLKRDFTFYDIFCTLNFVNQLSTVNSADQYAFLKSQTLLLLVYFAGLLYCSLNSSQQLWISHKAQDQNNTWAVSLPLQVPFQQTNWLLLLPSFDRFLLGSGKYGLVASTSHNTMTSWQWLKRCKVNAPNIWCMCTSHMVTTVNYLPFIIPRDP